MPFIEVKNLTKRFGSVEALKAVSLAVDEGELLTLLGPSGCGKTTTLYILAGFEDMDGGEVYIGGDLISSFEKGIVVPPHKRELGMVFQSYALWPHLTVFENIAYGLRMRKVVRNELAKTVEEVGRIVRLEGLLSRYPGQLSGGQQQRVAFARAIAYRPKALLLDEPLSNLDAALREEMRIELKELHERTRLTTVYVTHDQTEAMVLSDRIAVMNQGKIMQVGTPDEIYDRPANKFVATFVGLTNCLAGKVVMPVNLRKGLSKITLESGQELACLAPLALKAGEAVSLLLRAEDLKLSAQAFGDASLGKGRVEKMVNLGTVQEYWVKLYHLNAKVFRVHASPSTAFKPGDEVYVCYDPCRSWVVREPEGVNS